MPKAKDLTGKVFGHLTVIGLGEPYISPKGYKQRRWHCQCDCGRTVDVIAHALLSGETRSCGHAQQDYLKNKSPLTSLVGKVFGHLTVLKDDGARQGKNVLWLCQCDCGRQVHVQSSNLISGQTISCGHIGKQRLKESRERDLAAVPGTKLSLLGDKPNKNNRLGERNISIVNKGSHEYYRVAIMYKRKQYNEFYNSL